MELTTILVSTLIVVSILVKQKQFQQKCDRCTLSEMARVTKINTYKAVGDRSRSRTRHKAVVEYFVNGEQYIEESCYANRSKTYMEDQVVEIKYSPLYPKDFYICGEKPQGISLTALVGFIAIIVVLLITVILK